MNGIDLFFTPIVYQTAHKTYKQQLGEACDNYFSFFSDKKIRVLDNNTAHFFEETPSLQDILLTSLKIFSCGTIIIPTFFFIGKLLFRPDLTSLNITNAQPRQRQAPIAPPSPPALPIESPFTRIFNAPYNKERLLKFGLSDNDVEKSDRLLKDLNNKSEAELGKTAIPPFVIFSDLKKLFSHNWLNDNCVNEHLRLQIRGKNNFCFIGSHAVADQKLERIQRNLCTIFQTADGSKLEKLYDTNKTIFIPLNLNRNHWTLLVCDLGTKKLRYYDSLSGPQPKVIEEVKEYLSKIAHLEEVPLPPDAFACTSEKCPRQENGSDCGVFVLLAAKHLIEGLPLTYSQADTPYMRLKILSDFLSQGL